MTVVTLDRVYHVGTLDPADKGVAGESYEGDGLSFSVHPEDWAAIAKLGDDTPWEADVSGLAVLDGYALLKGRERELLQWALTNGWVSEVPAHEVRFHDAMDVEVRFFVGSREEAARELEELGGDASAHEVMAMAPTAQLCARLLRSAERVGRACVSVQEDVVTTWAQEHGYDGVWWDDEYAPVAQSCPRGVLFPQAFAKVAWLRGAEMRYAGETRGQSMVARRPALGPR